MLELSKLTRISRKTKQKKPVHIRIKGPLPSPGLKSESTKHMNKVDPLKKIKKKIMLHWKKPEYLPKKQGLFLKDHCISMYK